MIIIFLKHWSLSKWKWRFYNEHYALWTKFIKELYGPDGGFEQTDSHGIKSTVCSNIIDIDNDI